MLAVCISICNEPYSEFQVTLKALLKNLAYLFRRQEKIREDKVVIFLIQDGLEKISKNFIEDATG